MNFDRSIVLKICCMIPTSWNPRQMVHFIEIKKRIQILFKVESMGKEWINRNKAQTNIFQWSKWLYLSLEPEMNNKLKLLLPGIKTRNRKQSRSLTTNHKQSSCLRYSYKTNSFANFYVDFNRVHNVATNKS